MDWATVIGSLLSVVSTVVVAWFAYNQKTKDKMTDMKIERLKNEDMRKNKRRSDNSMRIYEELWILLNYLKASRVYIVQPHPLGNEELLTIHFEVKRRGVEAMKPFIQKMRISEVARFAGGLERNVFKVIRNIEEEVDDRYAQHLFSAGGTHSAIIKRLSDNRHDWVGSIIVEFCSEVKIDDNDAQHCLHTAATNIQYILPEITEES